MSKELVYIKENVENKEYIYTKELNMESSFIKCYEWLSCQYRQKNPNMNIDLRYKIQDDTCEIFYEEMVTEKGWVWNSNSTKRVVMYTLRKLPVLLVIPKRVITNETQTENEKENEKDNVSLERLPSIKEEPIINSPILNCLKNKGYTTELFNYFDGNTNDIMEDLTKWYTNELEPVIDNLSKLNIGNSGYAPNPFSPIKNVNQSNQFNQYNKFNTVQKYNTFNPFTTEFNPFTTEFNPFTTESDSDVTTESAPVLIDFESVIRVPTPTPTPTLVKDSSCVLTDLNIATDFNFIDTNFNFTDTDFNFVENDNKICNDDKKINKVIQITQLDISQKLTSELKSRLLEPNYGLRYSN